MPSSNAILGVRLYVSNSGTPGSISVQLCPDNGLGAPNTSSVLATTTLSVTANYTGWVTGAFGLNNGPFPVNPGQVYWMVFGFTTHTGAEFYGDHDTTPYSVWPYYSIYSGGTWTVQNNISLDMIVDTTKYTTIPWNNCIWSPSAGNLFIAVSGSLVRPQTYTNPYRGRVSYYYGVVQPALIMAALTGLDAPLGYDSPQAMSQSSGNYFMIKTFPLFRTKGTSWPTA